MITKILVIFLITFTPINCIPCRENPNCDCSSNDFNQIYINCHFENSIGLDVIIKSRNNLEIVCKNWIRWEDFQVRRYETDVVLKSLSFKNCGLSIMFSLKDLVKQFGVRETMILKFKSFKNLGPSLKRDHLTGFNYAKILILSDNGLTYIPSDLLWDYPSLEYIDLSNNDIDLPIDIFHETPNLREINLASSGVDFIHIGTFDKLRNLKSLNIRSNLLLEIKPGTFDQLVSLKNLDVSDNLLEDLPLSIFHDLQKLEKLDISMNNLNSIPQMLLENKKKLKELFLSDNTKILNTLPEKLLANFTQLDNVYLKNNGFQYLPENLFWSSISLKYINLNDNSLVTLPKNIFHGLINVKLLSIKNNKLETLPDTIFKYMKKLLLLDLSNNIISNVSRNVFFGLNSLEVLNIERNRIIFFDEKAFQWLFLLKVARLSHNPLNFTDVSHILPLFNSNTHLKELHLSNCKIKNFLENSSLTKSDLLKLDLRHNFIKNISMSSFSFPSRQISIDLRYNNITNFHFDRIENIVSFSKENRNININIGHNPLLCDCTLYDLLRYYETKISNPVYHYFNIILGNLTCIQNDGSNGIEIRNLNSSTYLCSEHDYFNTTKRCQDGCTCSVRPSDQTRILDCSNKNMSQLLFDDSKVNIQNNYSFIINFTGSSLTEIPLIKSLEDMNFTTFLFSNNNISKITLDKLPTSLQVLELHNNSISRIDTSVLDYLKSLHLKGLTLSGNPIICDCVNQHLISFLKESLLFYKDLEKIKCKDTHTPLNLVVSSRLCSSHSRYFVLYVVGSFCIIVLISVIFINIGNIRRFIRNNCI